ncbi:hypothetical protein [Candidatus Planktophila dulcis]|uniref:hypothetical protein n=1 Tax=Candidatus Planktophila dulcis TaxID=1884914 RepID=UPI00167FDF9D|nr:hypothetical protein [Candidatus Planktophila dulcis]
MARDVEHSISSEILRMCRSLKGFREVHFYVVESDSKDRTREKLEKLRNSTVNFRYISLGNLATAIPNRIERIRYCRNKYVEYIRENSEKFDYVVVADLDGINTGISRQAFESSFTSVLEWDMCAANQTGGYYDIYALRAKGWCESDYLRELEVKSQGLNNRQLFHFRTALIYDRMKKINRQSPWIAVESAFGGIAVYKSKLFLEADYSALDESALRQCEHVDFNLKLKNMGYKLFINPALINSHWNTYNINRFTVVRRIRGLRRKISEKLS